MSEIMRKNKICALLQQQTNLKKIDRNYFSISPGRSNENDNENKTQGKIEEENQQSDAVLNNMRKVGDHVDDVEDWVK